MLIGTVALMGTEKDRRWMEYVESGFFVGTITWSRRAWLPVGLSLVTGGLRPHSANLHPFIIDIQPPLLNWLSCLPLTLICFRSFSITVSTFLPLLRLLSSPAPSLTFNSSQMLSQRILARRLPQVAARAIAPRAAFSQVPALRAAEVEDPLQVYTLYDAYTVFPAW